MLVIGKDSTGKRQRNFSAVVSNNKPKEFFLDKIVLIETKNIVSNPQNIYRKSEAHLAHFQALTHRLILQLVKEPNFANPLKKKAENFIE